MIMHESIFITPQASLDEGRISWLYIDAAEDTLVESNLDEMYATDMPPLSTIEWEMR